MGVACVPDTALMKRVSLTQLKLLAGGLMDFAYNFIMQNGGLDTEKDYKYKAIQGQCNVGKENRHVVTIDGYEDVPPMDEVSLAKVQEQQSRVLSIKHLSKYPDTLYLLVSVVNASGSCSMLFMYQGLHNVSSTPLRRPIYPLLDISNCISFCG